MSMSFYIQAVIPPDETWKKMKKVFDACDEAGVSLPVQVSNFFNDERPDSEGVIFHLTTTSNKNSNNQFYYEIDIKSIPKHATKIRFIID